MISYSSPSDKPYGKLGNMAGGMAIHINGVKYYSSEHLYLCGEWSNNTPEHLEAQQFVCRQKSGAHAKWYAKAKYKHLIRADFPNFRYGWMTWCVWQKALQNNNFCEILLSTGNEEIVELNPKDVVWSKHYNDNGELVGGNGIGKILMKIRECLKTGISPQIDTELLNKAQIYLHGCLMVF